MKIDKYIIRILIHKLIRELMENKPYQVLSKLIKENNFKNYIEVGIWKGKTLFGIAKRDNHTQIIGIDNYSPKNYKGYTHGERMSHININDYNKIKNDVIKKSSSFNNVSIIIEKSLTAVKRFKDNSLDIVYIDALHDYKSVAEDIKAWLPKVRKGGILCGHDFSLKHFSVAKAVGDLIGYDNIEIKDEVAIWIYIKASRKPS